MISSSRGFPGPNSHTNQAFHDVTIVAQSPNDVLRGPLVFAASGEPQEIGAATGRVTAWLTETSLVRFRI